jgi:hypothetical protein
MVTRQETPDELTTRMSSLRAERNNPEAACESWIDSSLPLLAVTINR